MKFRAATTSDLVGACVRVGEAAAWEELQRRYHKAIAIAILRVARSFGSTDSDLIDELVQETYLKLCANGCRLLRESRAEHPDQLGGLLKQVAHNTAVDHFRSRVASKRGGGRPAGSLEEAAITVEGSGAAVIEQGVLLDQIDGLLRMEASPANSERDLTIFWLYYRTGLTSKAISELPSIGMTPKGVESALMRMTRYVRERIGEGAEAT